MDFTYTDRMAELKARAADLAGKIMVFENECEENNGLTPEAHTTIRESVLAAGLNAINHPASLGGAGLTILEQAVVQEELGKLTGALWDTVWRPANAFHACTPEQRERWLIPGIRGERRDAVAITEASAGSDPSRIKTTATPNGDRFVINGEKWFVTVGDAADHFLVLAKVDDLPTMFIVDKDTPGIELLRTPRYMHTFVYEHPEFAFRDVEVGPENVLGEIGQGYDLTRDWFTEERLMIGARTIGAAERALSLALDWARTREQGDNVLIEYQLIQAMLADSAVDIAANRALVHQVAWEFTQGADRKTLHAKAAMVKLSASEAAGRVVDRAVQIFGGRGYMRDYPVERLYRELRVDRIWEGTSEVQRLVIANELNKRGTDNLLAMPGSGATRL
ncbi:MAG TPA: acyl-CoA dehydrogenase family protein [Nocardioidaceae bacterium]|nr:acyl-CoA dehydrogenase family protein [Nocardioidaceae bacterium]